MNALVVASTQSVEVAGAGDALETLARPEVLQRLLRDYFSVAERCAGGLVRLRWSPDGPRFTLLWPPVALIAMGPPRFESSPDRRAITLDVLGGLLVDPGSAPRLAIGVKRRTDDLVASVELRDYAPRGVRLTAVRWLYLHSQARIHARVGLTYLRQLQQRWMAHAPA
jgi:hypothetical protein